jgi:predicted transposase/invertase (TIGR01784 family)
MADYFLRIYRRYPEKQIRQIVVYLRPSGSRLVYQTDFATGGMNHQFEVIRLWEQPPDLFLSAPGLLPFAVLAQSEGKEALLREVARRVDEIDSPRQQANVAASASLLAGLVLGKETIHQILRRDIMRESVIYQELIEEGRAEGRAEGKAEGLQEVARNLLAGGISVERVAGFTGLSLEKVRELQEQMDN